ncbi:MAG: hypothetical protein LBH60_00460 [Prevotellaceae bacterium]|jgi:hypothetical protein|nr:hypothetical protein [Prevotellaceae bacterium]
MNSRQFFYKVKALREAQIKYNRTKSNQAFISAKKLETEIDDEIARVEKIVGKPEQKDLF